ncbi:MAG: trigger factor [Dehalococcoidia bacterium]|nr:trigger factor [Dehalococcoidia bacterium]
MLALSVTTERLPRSLVALQIEVDPERVEASLEKAAKRVARQVRIPGFRPGKAPRNIVERTVGRPALLQEALDDLLPEVYNEVVESESLDPIAQPEFDLESMEPLVVKARVAVRPTIDMNEYRSLRAPRPEAKLDEADIDRALTNLRRRFATLEPVDRAVAWGDTVRADVWVQAEGQAEPHVEEDAEFRIEEGTVVSLPGFQDQLVGRERGGPYEFDVTLPEDFSAEELRGKTAHYVVTIHEVKQEILPDLDDEFAASLDEGFENVTELRARVESQVKQTAEQSALGAYHDEIVDLLVASAEMDYPEILVTREVDRIIDEQSNHASHTQEGLDRWLEAIGHTEAALRAELEPQADLNVRRALVVGELVRQEALEITEADIDARLDELVANMIGAEAPEDSRLRIRELLNTDAGRSQIKSDLTTKVALGRLVEIFSQPDEETTERARGSRRRRRTSEDGDDEAEAPEDASEPEVTAEAAE